MLDWGKKDEFVQAMFRRSHSGAQQTLLRGRPAQVNRMALTTYSHDCVTQQEADNQGDILGEG